MSGIITALLALLDELLPSITSSTTVQKALDALTQIVPFLIQEYQDLLPEVKAIMAALSANPAATADQLTALSTLDAQVDAAFEAAATAAQSQDGGS